MRHHARLATAATLLFALAGCSSSGTEGPAENPAERPAESPAGGTAGSLEDDTAQDQGTGQAGTGQAGTGQGGTGQAGTGLATATTSLGEVIVDAQGMTVYTFASDEPGSGESACTDECAARWPAVHADSAAPTADGVTGELGTITGTDGELQVTIDGRPLYTFADDKAPGDATGQGVKGVWWAVAPDGTDVTGAPMSPSTGS
ncbi:hypothetical protein ET495_12475 [Xylanimonas allomyrinae]|uniref:Lipoprotein with Yx(FWY)xxD motif n=1 Tax=Xylanimonas allomyrinae TaxID=2509459 RepID=A0A4P6EQ13_9MICO|nr:hypothetical protein [Xylanimonas allomyrinae]QAY63913.1 hypothetical protein ET495_12475 [Xylanimonas allomyrinae]